MTNVYLTIVNDRYVIRALALYRSLTPHLAGKQNRVYCIDDRAADLLDSLRLDQCSVVRPADFETDELRRIRDARAINEYCWTLKPVALLHALADVPDVDWAVYLDSDMMVFGDPDEGLQDSDAHVVLTPHRPTPGYFADFIDTVGNYNAGYAAFRGTPDGHAALNWWRQQCLADSPRVPRNGAYADQRYLNDLPTLFDSIVSSGHKGLNAGPWNILDQAIERDGPRVLVGGNELLTYHMQGFRILGASLFNLYSGPIRMPRSVRRHIYGPYARLLAQAHRELRATASPYANPPDDALWTPVALLRELRKATRGLSNLYPVLR